VDADLDPIYCLPEVARGLPEMPASYEPYRACTFQRTISSYGPTEDWRRAYPSQRAFHLCNARFKGFSGPVGTGKTVAVCWEALSLAYWNSGLPGMLLAPTYRMMADITKPTFVEILEREAIPYDPHKSEDSLTLKECGSKVLFRSASDPDRLRGPNLAWFGFDETTYCPEKSWQQMEARLRHPLAKCLRGFGGWTPKGYDWVYERFIGTNRLPGYQVILAKPNENLAILQNRPDFYEALKSSYDEKFYRQEVLGEYLNIFSGRAYYAYSEDRNLASVMYNPLLPIRLSCDFNVNPMAWVICQARPSPDGRETVHVLDEILLPDSNTREACEEFYKRVEPWIDSGRLPLNVYLYGDASGTSRSTAGGAGTETDYKIIRQFFAANSCSLRASFRVRDGNPFVKDRVACVNAMLQSAGDGPRILISPRCKELRKDLNQSPGRRTSTVTRLVSSIRATRNGPTFRMRSAITSSATLDFSHRKPCRKGGKSLPNRRIHYGQRFITYRNSSRSTLRHRCTSDPDSISRQPGPVRVECTNSF
jgi:hypothetical protein